MTRPPGDTSSQTSAFRQGQLRLLETIGSGGFGTVYRAEIVGEMGFRKAVAVKVLSEEGSTDAEIVGRLRDEARILGLLHHRAIVGVDDLLQVDGRWAVVMELVDGEDLARLIERGPMPARVVAEISREAALALSAAHTAAHPDTGEPLQVIHRDIKPANIQITSAGEVKVLDFGVARARFASREAETRAIRFGSPGYIAPERFDGEDSAASDVYSLGAVLVECLLGERLGRLPMSRSQHPAAVERALARATGAPAELTEIALAMLAYEPEDRPSAGEAARRLRVAALSGEGPWLSEWAPAFISSVRGNTVPRVPAPSADTLDLPPAVSAPLLEPLPPLTAEEGAPAQRVTPSLPPRAARNAGAPPVFSAEPSPSSRALPAAITYDEPALGPLGASVGVGGPALGLTGPLPEVEAPEERRAPSRRGPLLAAAAVLAALGVGAFIALGDGAADPPGSGDAAVEPPAVVDAAVEPAAVIDAAVEPAAGVEVAEATPSPPVDVPPASAAVASAPVAPTAPKPASPVRKASQPAPATGEVKAAEPAPVVAPAVAQTEPAPAPRGTVVVTGQVDEVALFSADGARHRPGRLAAGRYDVAWRFGEGELVRAGVSVDVAEGQVITLFCGASTGSCRVLR